MIDYSDLRGISLVLTAFYFLIVPHAIGVLIGVTALGIAWGGRRMGMVFGVLALASGLLGLGSLLLTAPHLWWTAVVPIGIGVVTVQAWYLHTGPATARRLRFNMRALLALILMISLVLGGIVSQNRQKRIEEKAAAILESLPASRKIEIVWRFGRVNDVVFLTLPNRAEIDRAVDALERFSQLRVLQISDPAPGRITQQLGRLTALRSLIAQGLSVTDDDLAPLANLQHLEFLELDGRQLTDAGLVHLSGLKRLRGLQLYGANQITPQGMANLRAQLPVIDKP